MPTLAAAEPPASLIQRSQIYFRRIVVAFALAAGLLLLCQLGVLLWAQNCYAGGECVVAAHSMMLVHDGTLYYDIHDYPYTVAPYTPLFYLADAGLQIAGLPAYQAGRLLSLTAALGLVALSWFLTLLYTNDRNSAAISALLCASSTLLLNWGTVGQVDVLAIFWAMAAFYLYSRYAVSGERTLVWAGVCVLLAFFTKQTVLACPVAIFLLLWFKRRKAALMFGGGIIATIAIITLSLDAALGGRFLADTVRANLNPYSAGKLLGHLRFTLFASTPLVIIVAAGARKAIAKFGAAPFVYLGSAAAVFLASAPKVGSDLNYQLEFTMVLVFAAALSLNALDFFELSFRHSRSWVTLLQAPLGLFLMVNLSATSLVILRRVVGEQQNREVVTALRDSLADGGRVLSADYNAVVRLRGRLDVEMAFYRVLVKSGVVDPEPLRRDLANSLFSTVVLLEDVRTPHAPLDIEISSLPEAQLAAIRDHYELVKHVPGPALSGVYVYKPRGRPGGAIRGGG